MEFVDDNDLTVIEELESKIAPSGSIPCDDES